MSSIAKRPNGRWRARYRDEGGKERARHFDRKVDAQRWLNEVTASLVTGQYVDPAAGRATFSTWFHEWSERQVWAPMTRVQADLVARSVPFGDVPLSRLRESHLQAWVRQMQLAGYAPTTISTRMATVRAGLKAALRERRISMDPSVGVALPRRLRPEVSMEVATAAQVGQLLSAADAQMRTYIATCAFAGLRLGEASALNVEDIDFLQRRVRVQRQVQRVRGGRAELKAPKYESFRTVFACDQLLEILANHLDQHMTSGEGWLFTTGRDYPISPSSVNARWQRTARSAGSTDLTLHSLRHYFASGLIAAGCDVVTVQRALGHKSPSVTLNTYSHLWPSAEDKTRSAAGALAAEALTVTGADPLRTVL